MLKALQPVDFSEEAVEPNVFLERRHGRRVLQKSYSMRSSVSSAIPDDASPTRNEPLCTTCRCGCPRTKERTSYMSDVSPQIISSRRAADRPSSRTVDNSRLGLVVKTPTSSPKTSTPPQKPAAVRALVEPRPTSRARSSFSQSSTNESRKKSRIAVSRYRAFSLDFPNRTTRRRGASARISSIHHNSYSASSSARPGSRTPVPRWRLSCY